MQELQVHNVEQLFVQGTHVDDVAGQEAGSLPLPDEPLVLLSKALPAEGQDHQPGAIDEHGGAAPVGVHPHSWCVHILHEAVPKLRLLEVVQGQGLQVMGARVVLHH